VEVILTGGVLRKIRFLWSALAEESLRKLSADLLFLGVDGFDVQYGLTTPICWKRASIVRCLIRSPRRDRLRLQ